jgi:hypothetical protein
MSSSSSSCLDVQLFQELNNIISSVKILVAPIYIRGINQLIEKVQELVTSNDTQEKNKVWLIFLKDINTALRIFSNPGEPPMNGINKITEACSKLEPKYQVEFINIFNRSLSC